MSFLLWGPRRSYKLNIDIKWWKLKLLPLKLMKKNADIQVSSLWRQYQNIRFRDMSYPTTLPADFHVLTACNPGSKMLPQFKNTLRTQKLARYLDNKQIDFGTVDCGDRQFNWVEASLLVDCNLDECIRLARLYQQNAIYSVVSGELFLVPTLMIGVSKVALGKFSDFLVSI